MPRIINTYDGNSVLGDTLGKIGESIFGDQAKNEVYRQKAFGLKRNNDAAEPYAAALRDNNTANQRYFGALTDRGNHDIAQGSLLSVSSGVSDPHDPRLDVAARGAGQSYGATAQSQDHAEANTRTTTGMNNATTLESQRIASDRAAASQQAVSKRQEDRLAYEFEHKPTIMYNRQDGRSAQFSGDQVAAAQGQGWEPVAAEPPKTTTLDTAGGDKATVQWNRAKGQWERFDADKLPAVTPTPSAASAVPGKPAPFNGYGQPGQAGTIPVSEGFSTPAATNAAQPDQGVWGARPNNPDSLRTNPVVPPGVNAPAYRTELAKKTADAATLLQDQAAGSIDFLKQSGRAKEIFKNSPEVFGPWAGSPTVQSYVRAPLRMMGNANAGANMGKYNDVDSVTKELSTSGLKAAFGARPTNFEVSQNAVIYGGLKSADNQAAIRAVERQEAKHFATINRALAEGHIRPENIPPEVVKLGIETGALNPRFFPNGGAQPTAAPQQPTAPQAAPTRWERGPDGQPRMVQ